jgi:uncharacterized protein YwqG
MPVFSEEVSFSKNGSLRYYGSLSDERWGINSMRTNELAVDFYLNTEIKNDLTKNYAVDFTEDKSVFATAYCAVDYGNLEWLISLAQSEDVMVSLE